jgi:hypothetical protein
VDRAVGSLTYTQMLNEKGGIEAVVAALNAHQSSENVQGIGCQALANIAANNATKDADKALVIQDFQGWEKEVRPSNHETFRWLFEEYRVSIFAQELGTAQPVSLKRLEALLT